MLANESVESAAGQEVLEVAVIVPIYNVEQYLTECLDSVAAQTIFDSLQVILVDDGSTDSSGAIAEEFAARYSNVTLVRQENRGLGGARNRGLLEVTAPFVTFLDSDDRLPSDSVETLLRVIIEHDAELAIGKMKTFPKPTRYAWLKHLNQRSKVIEGIENAEELIHGASVCNKLFRTDILKGMGLQFGEGVHFEDVYVSLPVMLAAKRLAVTSAVVYEYRQRAAGGSIMDSLWTRTDNYWDHLAVEEFLADLRRTVPGIRRPVVDLFLVRSFQGFALRAPDVFEEPDLDAFYTRAVEVYRGMAPETIRRGCHDARHRIPLLALALEDWALFAKRASVISSLEAKDGRLYLKLDHDLPDLAQALLAANKWTAHLETVEARGRNVLRVTGRFHVDGLPLTSPLPSGLAVRLRGSALTVPAQNVVRQTVTAGIATDTWSGFVCEIPVKKLRTGEHQFRLVFETATGQASVFMRPTSGALNAARTVTFPSCRLLLRKRTHSAALQVSQGSGRRARLQWRRRYLAEDIRHIVHRRPMWGQRLLRLLTSFAFLSPVWLLGERFDTAQDNSFVLFEHLRRTRRDIRAYYLIDKKSPDYSRIRGLGRVIPHSGWRHRLLMLHAAVLVNSYDINSYMLPRGWGTTQFLEHLSWRIGSRRVFLQHGVTWHNVSAALHKGVTGVDMFVTTSAQEAEAARSTMNYSGEVALTGFPRFDRLRRGPLGRRILIMPTWRKFLVVPSYRAGSTRILGDFETSTFAVFWRTLLNDAAFLDLLDRTDTTVEFFGHYELAGALRSLAPDHARVVVSHYGDRSVQEAILDASLLVTDWSSTFFDAAYAGRPVVLLPFDEEDYRTKQYARGYLDSDEVGFGPVARTVEGALAAIGHYIATDFQREADADARVQSFFAHRDERNCERVVEAIARVVRGERASVPGTEPATATPSAPLALAA